MLLKRVLFILLLAILGFTQEIQENRIQQSAGGKTTIFHQSSSTFQSSSGGCCRPQAQPQPTPQLNTQCCHQMQSQQVSAPIQSRSQSTNTWQISGYSARQQSPQYQSQPAIQLNNHNVEYKNVDGQNGGESLKVDYNNGQCVVTLDSVSENGVQRAIDHNNKAKFRAFADQLNSWQQQIRNQMNYGNRQQQGDHWNSEPRVPDCPCALQLCGQSAQKSPNQSADPYNFQNQSSNWPQPAHSNFQNQQSHMHSYEFHFNNGRCVLKDGQVSENGRARALTGNEKAKLDDFKRQFDQYTQRLHDQMKQKMNSYFQRDNKQQNQQTVEVQQFEHPSPPQPPCLCSETACGRQQR